MNSVYNPAETEDAIYAMWENGGCFAPKKDAKTPYTIIMPPPNANDPLHIGHAMFVTLEDILIRYHRMKGEAALWVPGTDHAGIETQYVFEKKLKKEGKTRFDFDRETLYSMIWDYVQKNSDIAVSQLKKLGASADWQRFSFTLDPSIVSIVIDTFQELNEKSLVYRDLRLVNFCTRCGTGYSELEAKHEVKKDPFVYLKYGPFVIGTVRPETKFRDTALAVHPKDKRYASYIGKTFDIPGLLGPIHMTVVADADVDPEFGTGIMKVTPAHDFHDFELGKRYKLPVTPIIDLKGKMDFSWFLSQDTIEDKYRERATRYHGLHVSKARPMIIEDLKAEGLLEKIDENYEHTVSVCYRCGTVLEPLPIPQFYVRVEELTKPVLTALKEKQVKILGPGYEKILKHWLTNLKDWNISRQIVWGIRMPVWYSLTENPDIHLTFLDATGTIKDGKASELLKTYTTEDIRRGLQKLTAPIEAHYTISALSPGEDYLQETDTFDTWFSSSQWPFATLMATKNNNDFSTFYPTAVLETAYDILVFWVMRMLMMGIFKTGTVPFHTVYLHGLVRDEQGQKMSKSKGNVVNPIDSVRIYGADALRMALAMSTAPGRDSTTGEGKIRGMRNLTNKLWNAARYVSLAQATQTKGKRDAAVKKHLNSIEKKITKLLDQNKIGLAAEKLYQEFWHWYCDTCIEEHKKELLSYTALKDGLLVFLHLFHPFMPFITEKIWQDIKEKDAPALIVSSWPGGK